MAELAGTFDDVFCRVDLTADELYRRIQLGLGRLSLLRRMEEDRLALERQSVTDFKTGTYNDRYFHRRLREEFNRARRHHTAISCVMLDFDNFKEINDTFDHAFGDFVLLSFAKKLRSIIRDIDIPARFGGDEFVLLLPNTGLDEAVQIAERIRKIVSEYRFETQIHSTSVSLSIGISSFDGIEESSPEEFLRRADCALLEAKRRGRNRVILYPQVAGRDHGPRRGREDASESGTA
jgi:diguanylate cyclase (GGDEF)-like protein